jgi:phosphoribosylpyrophosphate synthetase
LFLGSPEPQQYLEFFSAVYAIPRYLARSFVVVLPYFPTGTMERVDREGEVATAKTLTRMLSATPHPQVGQTAVVVFDMHALATRFFFSDNIKIVLPSYVPELLLTLKEQNTGGVDVTICFPDDGAKKRFSKLFAQSGFPIACCGKTRGDGEARIIHLTEGTVVSRSVVIVDDLAQSGSTLSSCRDMLYQQGATAVSAFVVHGVFPKESWRKFLTDENGIELASRKRGFTKFLLTDSIPATAAAVRSHRPFQVLPLHVALVRLLSDGNAAGSHL